MMERSAVTVVRPTGGDFGAYASTTKSSASSAAPTKRKYRARGISRSLHPRDRADRWLNREWRDLFLTWRGQATKLPPRCGLYENCPDLEPFPFRWNRNGRLLFLVLTVFLTRTASTSLEN